MMTLAEWTILGAVLLYLLTLAPAKALGYREFNNADPRDPRFYEKPIRKRAQSAHQNGIETFPFFAAAILLAEFRSSPQGWIDAFAIAFLLVRLAYVAAYLADRPTARSLLWSAGFVCNLAIFLLPAVFPR